MAGLDDDHDADLADRGDDRPGVDEAEGDDYSALGLDDDFDDDDDDDEDYPDDAGEDEIDLVVALYREDGTPVVQALELELANDLDGLLDALRRLPGDAGAVGMVSIEQDMFVIARVRGRVVQLMLSDSIAGQDWPIARDVLDYLGLDVPEDEEDSEPVGDLDLFADAGLPEMEMEAICDESDDTLEALEEIAEKIGFGTGLSKIIAALDLD